LLGRIFIKLTVKYFQNEQGSSSLILKSKKYNQLKS